MHNFPQLVRLVELCRLRAIFVFHQKDKDDLGKMCGAILDDLILKWRHGVRSLQMIFVQVISQDSGTPVDKPVITGKQDAKQLLHCCTLSNYICWIIIMRSLACSEANGSNVHSAVVSNQWFRVTITLSPSQHRRQDYNETATHTGRKGAISFIWFIIFCETKLPDCVEQIAGRVQRSSKTQQTKIVSMHATLQRI